MKISQLESWPLWTKWLGGILLMSVFGTLIGTMATLVLPLAVILLCLFPGKNPARPRLFFFAPWIWGLSWTGALVIAVLRLVAPQSLSEPMLTLSPTELGVSLVTTPIVFYFFVQKHARFRVLFVAVSVVSILVSVVFGAERQDQIVEQIASLFTEATLAIYIYWKYPIYAGQSVVNPASTNG